MSIATTAPDAAGRIRLASRAAQVPPSATAALDAQAKALIALGVDVINLSSGEPAFPTVEPAGRAALEAIASDFTRYTPAAGIPELRTATAGFINRHGTAYEPSEVVITAGAKQALHYAFTTLVEPGDEILIPAPYWVSYPHLAALAGGTLVPVQPFPGAGLKVTADQLRAAVTDRTTVLLLNNPANPSGVVYDRTELAALVQVAIDHDLAIISDEICDHWVFGDSEHTSVAALGPEAARRTLTVGGVSKTFAMTGWRIGWVAAPTPVAEAITAIQSHTASAPSSISQKAALGALTSDLAPELERRRLELDDRRLATIKALEAVPGVEVDGDPTGAFFLLADVSGTYGRGLAGQTITSAADFARLLLTEANVAVVPGADFAAPHHVRISYTVPPDRLAEALPRIAEFAHQLRLDPA
ncbi:pyridoxal phosphate-dependent aminotransferase [Streptomyces sp. G1]|uniref:pyridoxal phosphate-dependent aminotransferase n=1 Tax=Streptomyces sp. G1 TaxID=361572 RepID=UPI00202EBCF6|nr:pyridoxal phosphate-dependent aminotransferase [Streptomyces sp. G1]MCM1971343.1 pyridoxal phosphate-dependent aminotransferase [Streptomyces sp. G1]